MTKNMPHNDLIIVANVRRELVTKRIDVIDPYGLIETFIGGGDYFTKLSVNTTSCQPTSIGKLVVPSGTIWLEIWPTMKK